MQSPNLFATVFLLVYTNGLNLHQVQTGVCVYTSLYIYIYIQKHIHICTTSGCIYVRKQQERASATQISLQSRSESQQSKDNKTKHTVRRQTSQRLDLLCPNMLSCTAKSENQDTRKHRRLA